MIVIYGGSDDLIEIEGDIDAEFYCHAEDEEDPVYLAFSDGTLISASKPTGAAWQLLVVFEGESEISIRADETTSNKITLDGPIKWAILGSELAN